MLKITSGKVKANLKTNYQTKNTETPQANNNTESQSFFKTPFTGFITFTGLSDMKNIQDLKSEVAEIRKIGRESTLIEWKRETEELSDEELDELAKKETDLALQSKERLTSKRMKRLLEAVKNASNLSDADKALIKTWQKHYDEETKIPKEFTAEMAELLAKSPTIWSRARKDNQYEDFAATLTSIIEKSKEQTEYLSKEQSPYDVLLDMYEPTMTVEKLDKLFRGLRADLVPLVAQIKSKVDENPSINEFDFLKKPADIKQMEEFSLQVAKDMGFDFSRGEIGKTAHPFMSGVDSPFDVRFSLTDLSKKPDFKEATVADCIEMIGTIMHEGGHALVEQGADKKLYRTGLTGATSGMHESQSRLWENMVGKSKPFWKHYYPKLQAQVDAFKDIPFDDFFRAINIVKPSMIRVDADEATYNLHVMLRYDLEKEMINSGLDAKEIVKTLPEKWNKKMNEYLGVTPQSDSEGALQDVHWSLGYFGYFPTYTIGNLASAQIFNKAKEEIPDLDQRLEQGDLKTLHNWLKEKMYKNGKVYTPDEIIQNITDEPLNPKYFTEYLKDKYSDIYKLQG